MLPTCPFQLIEGSSRLKVFLSGILPIVLSSVSNNGQTDRTGVDYVIMSRVHFCQSVVTSVNCSLGKYYNLQVKSLIRSVTVGDSHIIIYTFRTKVHGKLHLFHTIFTIFKMLQVSVERCIRGGFQSGQKFETFLTFLL